MQTYAFQEIATYGRTCQEKASFDKKLAGTAQDLGVTLAVLLAVLKPVVALDTHEAKACGLEPATIEKAFKQHAIGMCGSGTSCSEVYKKLAIPNSNMSCFLISAVNLFHSISEFRKAAKNQFLNEFTDTWFWLISLLNDGKEIDKLREVLPYCTIGRVDGGDPLHAVKSILYEIPEKLGNLFAFEEVWEKQCDCIMRRPKLRYHLTKSVSGPTKFSFCDFFTFWAKSRTCQCGKTCRSLRFPSTTRYLLLCLNRSPPYSKEKSFGFKGVKKTPFTVFGRKLKLKSAIESIPFDKDGVTGGHTRLWTNESPNWGIVDDDRSFSVTSVPSQLWEKKT